MPAPAQITSEAVQNNLYVIHLSGEVDINYFSDLENTAKPILEKENIQGIILDCKELTFIDSKIVGFIAYLYTNLSKTGRKLVITGANETINDILTLVGLTAIVPSFPSVDQALDQLTPTAT